jgi:hypothetical protein
MSIKFYPLGNLPISSSFAVTSSFSLENIAPEPLTTSASFAEVTAFSIRPAPKGPPGRDELIDSRERNLIELQPD